MKKVIVYLAAISLVYIGCSKTDEETESRRSSTNTGGVPGNCDTASMKYQKDVQPILQVNCYSCHGNGIANGGVSLDNYNGVKQRATSGVLLGVITHAPGFPPMPRNRPKLSDCDINKIKGWINQGALNN